jgi:hypothetical protein
MQNASTVESNDQWAAREFSGAVFPDKRLVKRLIKIAAHFAQNPSGSLPEASGSWKEAKAAYRFFDNQGVSVQAILKPHQEQTRQRAAAHATVLVVQDTTGLNFQDHPATPGLGLVGPGRHGALGIWLHSSLAFTPEGAALGVVAVDWWVRDPKDFGKAAQRHGRPIEEKESYRWLKSYQATVQWAQANPGTRFVNISDREGDLYELFALAAQHPETGVLVRARHEREDRSGASMTELMARVQPAGTMEIEVARKPGQPARRAKMAVKYTSLSLRAPQRSRDSEKPVCLWIVEAQEILAAGSTKKPLFWRLVTNVPVTDFASAVEKIQWYGQRWSIEEFHRILKSGCGVEDRQLETVERLSKIMVMDVLVAWRVLALTRTARRAESLPAAECFGEDELAVLKQLQLKKGKVVTAEVTVREAVRLVAQLGGFLARKGDGEPGSMTLWRGLECLSQLTLGYQLAKLCG